MRIFTDACVPYPIVELARKLVEWDVQTAYDANLANKVLEDVLVRHATTSARIFLIVDGLGGEHGAKVSRELRENGGKVLRVGGGPGQNPYRAIGRILYHYPDWEAFLRHHSGVAIIEDLRKPCLTYSPQNYHYHFHPIDARQFEEYLAKRRKQQHAEAKPKRKPAPPSQGQMLIG